MIVVVDYGVGNIGSILNMFKRIGLRAIGSSSMADVEQAERIVLPGVGAFDAGMAKLLETGLVPVLKKRVFGDRVPLLGICLGMQILCRGSEEGSLPGLGWIDAEVVRFRRESADRSIKIPHMGWNEVKPARSHPILQGLEERARFYFVHSYHAVCSDDAVLCATPYGYPFASGIVRDNLVGVQFHPEKSHKFGFRLLKNFGEM